MDGEDLLRAAALSLTGSANPGSSSGGDSSSGPGWASGGIFKKPAPPSSTPAGSSSSLRSSGEANVKKPETPPATAQPSSDPRLRPGSEPAALDQRPRRRQEAQVVGSRAGAGAGRDAEAEEEEQEQEDEAAPPARQLRPSGMGGEIGGFTQMSWARVPPPESARMRGRGVVPVSEVKRHRKQDDAWTVVKGKVYDITPYLRYHPGGVEQLMKGAGRDSTALFNKYHPWVNVDFLLEKCFIGILVPDQP